MLFLVMTNDTIHKFSENNKRAKTVSLETIYLFIKIYIEK